MTSRQHVTQLRQDDLDPEVLANGGNNIRQTTGIPNLGSDTDNIGEGHEQSNKPSQMSGKNLANTDTTNRCGSRFESDDLSEALFEESNLKLG